MQFLNIESEKNVSFFYLGVVWPNLTQCPVLVNLMASCRRVDNLWQMQRRFAVKIVSYGFPSCSDDIGRTVIFASLEEVLYQGIWLGATATCRQRISVWWSANVQCKSNIVWWSPQLLSASGLCPSWMNVNLDHVRSIFYIRCYHDYFGSYLCHIGKEITE